MILQYRGYKNVWYYTEAETIGSVVVWVGKETHDYRKDGCRHKMLQEELSKSQTPDEDDCKRLNYVKEMHEAVDRLIKEETHWHGNIVYFIGDKTFDNIENVVVVMLQRKENSVAYVFDQINNKGIYLLNENGKTVQHIN